MKSLKIYFTKHIVLVTILFLFSFSIFAQDEPQKKSSDFWNHVRFGGGVGLSFGSGFFSGTLAPSAIYQFNDQFALGTGLNFTYASESNFYNSTIIGASILGLFNPIPEIQLSAEFEELYVSRNFDDRVILYQDEDYWYPALFLGAGYSTRNVTFGIRFDVLYDSDRSIYYDPWVPFVRVYF